MRSIFSLAQIIAVLAIAAAIPAAADSPRGAAPAAEGAPVESVVAESSAPAVADAPAEEFATSVSRDMDETAAAFHARLEALNEALGNETDPEGALAIQKEVEQLKIDTEIRYIEIQARHARAAGMLEFAEQAEAMLAAMRGARDASQPAVETTPAPATQPAVETIPTPAAPAKAAAPKR